MKKTVSAKKIVGIVLLSLSIFLFLASTTLLNKALGMALLGVFGVYGFFYYLAMAFVGFALTIDAKYQYGARYIVYTSLFAFSLGSIIHLAFTHGYFNLGYGGYLANVFSHVTPGGVIFGVFDWPVQSLLFPVGAYVVFILLMTVMLALMIDYLHSAKNMKKLSYISGKDYNVYQGKNPYQSNDLSIQANSGYNTLKQKSNAHLAEPTSSIIQHQNDVYAQAKASREKEKPVISEHEDALIRLGFRKPPNEPISSRDLFNPSSAPAPKVPDMERSKNIILTPKIVGSMQNINAVNPLTGKVEQSAIKETRNADIPINGSTPFGNNLATNSRRNDNSAFSAFLQSISPNGAKPNEDGDLSKPFEDVNNESLRMPDNRFGMPEANNSNTNFLRRNEPELSEEETEDRIDKIIREIKQENPSIVASSRQPEVTPNPFARQPENIEESESPRERRNIFDNRYNPVNNDVEEMEDDSEDMASESSLVRNFRQNFKINRPEPKPAQESMFAPEPASPKRPTFTVPSNYIRPPVELLNVIRNPEESDDEELRRKATILEETLANFRVPVNVVAITKGPAVTRFELQVQQGIAVKKILQYQSDIAMALESNGGVRIEAPIPGKNAVGVEVPNKKIATIGLRDIITTQDFTSSSHLAVGLGRDISGSTILCDIKQMPHLLVAGSTGSGKSVCLSVILVSLLYKLGPDDLKLILIDPKRVEFSAFNGLPHMMIPEAITEPKDAINALAWAVGEMDRRFTLFHELRVNKIDDYNNRPEVRSGKEPKLPNILIVIDELADLMMTGKKDVEDKIKRIAQLARAAGIHLIVATQRPSVDVITGTIKVNLPSRIAFMVTSGADSKTILDQVGAENLLGKGDMLYSPYNFSEPRRVQCAFISGDEVRGVVEYIKAHNQANFDGELEKEMLKKEDEQIKINVPEGGDVADGKTNFDPILPEALKLAIESRQASVSMIQRRFAVGYARAARILDQMEMAKFVSPSDGSKARSVYITMDEYNAIFGDNEENY